jgi:hypothetical protein
VRCCRSRSRSSPTNRLKPFYTTHRPRPVEVRGEQGSETLGDVKTLSHSRSGYTRARICGDGRPVEDVDARADKFNSEYDLHTIMVDSKFNGCPQYERDPVTNDIRRKMRSSHVGPVRCLLRTYGPTKG